MVENETTGVTDNEEDTDPQGTYKEEDQPIIKIGNNAKYLTDKEEKENPG